MAEFASKGVAGSGLGLGIAGTTLGVLNSGAGLFGGWGRNNNVNYYDNCCANRFELQQEGRIARLESEVALRDANIYNDQKLLEVYKYFDGQIKDIRQTMCDQRYAQGIINAKVESGLDVMASQIASINTTLATITKTVIPNAAICPGFGNVTVQSTGCSCVNGYNSNGNI